MTWWLLKARVDRGLDSRLRGNDGGGRWSFDGLRMSGDGVARE